MQEKIVAENYTENVTTRLKAGVGASVDVENNFSLLYHSMSI